MSHNLLYNVFFIDCLPFPISLSLVPQICVSFSASGRIQTKMSRLELGELTWQVGHPVPRRWEPRSRLRYGHIHSFIQRILTVGLDGPGTELGMAFPVGTKQRLSEIRHVEDSINKRWTDRLWKTYNRATRKKGGDQAGKYQSWICCLGEGMSTECRERALPGREWPVGRPPAWGTEVHWWGGSPELYLQQCWGGVLGLDGHLNRTSNWKPNSTWLTRIRENISCRCRCSFRHKWNWGSVYWGAAFVPAILLVHCLVLTILDWLSFAAEEYLPVAPKFSAKGWGFLLVQWSGS